MCRPCHGEADPTSVGSRSFHAAHLSKAKRAWVRTRLLAGNSQAQVLAEHKKWFVQRLKSLDGLDRDCFLSPSDVRNIAAEIDESTYKFHKNDAESVRLWVQRNQDSVFFYEQQNEAEGTAFSLGLQSSWQLDMLVKHGHQSIICMDATHGTNQWKVRANQNLRLNLVQLVLCSF